MIALHTVRAVTLAFWFIYWLLVLCVIGWMIQGAATLKFSILDCFSMILAVVSALMYGTVYLYLAFTHTLLGANSLYFQVAYAFVGEALALAAIVISLIKRRFRNPTLVIAFIMVLGYCDQVGIVPYPQSLSYCIAFLIVALAELVWLTRRMSMDKYRLLAKRRS